MSNFRVAYVPWYRPIMLLRTVNGKHEHIGWVWRSKTTRMLLRDAASSSENRARMMDLTRLRNDGVGR